MIYSLVAWAADDVETWKVDDAHGAVHEVPFDVREGTWVDVTVHGDTVVFDLLGDLWSVSLSGGEAVRLTSGISWDSSPAFSPDGKKVAFSSDRSGNENLWVMNADGSDPVQITKEDAARCTEPVWDPTGPFLLYRRRKVDTSSIGLNEIWAHHLEGGNGFPLTVSDDTAYAIDLAVHDRFLYFSALPGRFQYEGNALQGLYSVVRLDRRDGAVVTVAGGVGSATRPLVSHDGRTLYVVSRDRERTQLEAVDLGTGRRRVIDDRLSPDEMEGFAIRGSYPRMDLTDDGDLVLWASGGLWRLDPETGERTAIPFRARGSLTMADVTRPAMEIPDTVKAKVVRWPVLSSRNALAFSAMGLLWVRTEDGRTTRIGDGTGYAPAWSADGTQLAWTSWDDERGGSVRITGPDGKTTTVWEGGQATNPAFGENGDELVFLRGMGGTVSPDLGDEATFEIVHLKRERGGLLAAPTWKATPVTTVESGEIRRPRLHLHGGRVWFVVSGADDPHAAVTSTLVSVALDGTDRIEHVHLGRIQELAISPDFTRIAYKLDHQVRVAALPSYAVGVDVEALPSAEVTHIVGDWLAFGPDGSEVTWVEGPTFQRLAVADLWKPEPEDVEGVEEAKDPLAPDPRVVSLPLEVTLPRARPTGTRVLENARVVTMNGDEVLERVNVVVEGDRIVEIGPDATRPGAEVVDCAGKTVIPGLIDTHAHLHFSSVDVFPEQEWRYQVNLDFGVTTVQDPSTFTDLVFTQQERVEAGLELGPRVYSTGYVLYGAEDTAPADTPTLDAARAHVRRQKLYGATSVKVYQQSQRERRQWYVQACREEGVLCVPEGGGDTPYDLTMVVDGFDSIEHTLPTTPLYADVRALFAGSTLGQGDGYGTFYSPVFQVAYGSVEGMHWFEQRGDPAKDERLLLHTPRRTLDARMWRRGVLMDDEGYRFLGSVRDAAALRDAGVHVTTGSHGELQGLGMHWELWSMALEGGMTNHEALRAATIEGARYLGLDRQLGTVEVGKLADLIVLDGDPLADLHHSTDIHAVLKNGEWVVR